MAKGKSHGKNRWALFLLLICGIVIGSFVGYLVRNIGLLSWMYYGLDFSIGDIDKSNIVSVNLGVLVIHFGLRIKITVTSVIGAIASIFIYEKL